MFLQLNSRGRRQRPRNMDEGGQGPRRLLLGEPLDGHRLDAYRFLPGRLRRLPPRRAGAERRLPLRSRPGQRLRQKVLVDNCAMQLVMDPGQFDVILTENMFEASVRRGQRSHRLHGNAFLRRKQKESSAFMSQPRLCPGYCRKGHCQSHCHHPFGGHDAAVFPLIWIRKRKRLKMR